ncbi:hypothetical protein [Acinetobacter lanii]|uniref:Uncharacterized protein n=1 Tax=Acinetobacter lanii TaxID=2715163 RepID=A0A6G8S0W1_9GAMM|nr:hypothetical protein G8D99_01040 [Acinetobacter lanii]
MRTQFLALSLMTGLSFASVSAFAEPPVQAGETLESLSKVKVTTTVNGQPGSLNDLVSSGQVKLLGDANAAPTSIANITPPEAVAPTANPEAVQPATPPQAENLSEAPQQLSNDAENVDPTN